MGLSCDAVYSWLWDSVLYTVILPSPAVVPEGSADISEFLCVQKERAQSRACCALSFRQSRGARDRPSVELLRRPNLVSCTVSSVASYGTVVLRLLEVLPQQRGKLPPVILGDERRSSSRTLRQGILSVTGGDAAPPKRAILSVHRSVRRRVSICPYTGENFLAGMQRSSAYRSA